MANSLQQMAKSVETMKDRNLSEKKRIFKKPTVLSVRFRPYPNIQKIN